MANVLNQIPIISVITVVFNDEIRMQNTLKSVSSQKFSNLEYIIVDGNSSDNTITVIKESKVKIDVLISEPDKGIYDAMNKGIRKASGDWIIFLNAGDTFFADNTLTQIFIHKEINNYDVLYGKHMWDYESFKKESKERPLELMHKTLPFCHQASLSKRELLLKYPFDLEYKIIADYNFFRKAYYSGAKFIYRPVVFVNYLCTGGVSGDNLIKVYKENFRITKDINIFFRIFLFLKKSFRHYMNSIIKLIIPASFINYIKQKS